MSAANFLRYLRDTHGRAAKAPTRTAAGAVPEAVAPDTLPGLETLCVAMGEATPGARFLLTGEATDRSEALHAAAVGLRWAGLDGGQILAVLENNPHAWEVALAHRQEDADKAREYLWRNHAGKAAAEGTTTCLDVVAMFDIVTNAELPNADPIAQRGAGLQWATVEQFCADESRLEWFVHGVLPEAELCAVFGASGAGKTFFVLHLVAAIAKGGTFYGIEAAQAPVAVVALEGVHGFRDRLRAYSARHGAVPNLHIAHGTLNLREPGSEREIVPHLRAIGPRGLLVVDTMAQATPGCDENSGKDMSAVVARIKAIHRRTGWAVLLVAHSGKDARAGLRGWSGIKAALDCEIEVIRAAGYRAATISKLKDGAGEGNEFRFDIETVVLSADRTGAVLVERGSTQFEPGTPAPAKPQGKNQEAVFAAFEQHQQGGAIARAELLRHATEALAGTGKPRDRAREALEGLCRTGGVLVADGDIVRRASGGFTGGLGGAISWG